jgi:hypothetical protein
MKFLIVERDNEKTVINLNDMKSICFQSMKELGFKDYFYAELVHDSLGHECVSLDLQAGDADKFLDFLKNDAKTLVLTQFNGSGYNHTTHPVLI